MQIAQWHKSTVGNQSVVEWDSRKSRADLFFSPQNAHFQKTNQPKPKQKALNQPKQTKNLPQNPTETEKKGKSSQAKVILNNF